MRIIYVFYVSFISNYMPLNPRQWLIPELTYIKNMCYLIIEKIKCYNGVIMKDHTYLLEQLNQETKDHSLRVASLSRELAPKLDLDPGIAFWIGMLHDVGKMYIPTRIMKKNGKLTRLEREIIDMHAYFGYRLLKDDGESPLIYMPILFHHGYWKPKLEVAEDEPMDEKTIRHVYLLHSCDVFDAMSSPRVYHTPFPKSQILAALASDILCTPRIVELLDKIT